LGESFIYGPHRGCGWHRIDPAQVVQSCNCFAYQANEYDGWEASAAYAFIDSLKSLAVSAMLPENLVWGAPEPDMGDNVISFSSMMRRGNA
jgi:hypothetical protein